MKTHLLKISTALGLQFLAVLILFLVLGILGIDGTPSWVYAAVGAFVFSAAWAAQENSGKN
ncbi:hypothetical protein ABH922_000640 [Rhodococcus sp. 27YEA15]|uniref:hypothetical protein n=1 Tax=Rhodococcus sp. 27YEA15 TaxID=3156259 RepID=UPI003C7DBAF7